MKEGLIKNKENLKKAQTSFGPERGPYRSRAQRLVMGDMERRKSITVGLGH
jgi:hypothetical protein